MEKLAQLANQPNTVGGIKFAPINVPLQRRWQTFAVASWVFLLFGAPFLCLILPFYLLFATSYWWLVPAYCVWFVFTFYADNSRKLRKSIFGYSTTLARRSEVATRGIGCNGWHFGGNFVRIFRSVS